VQVDPTKPKLKPPGTKRLKLDCDVLLSTSGFRFNLRRYNEDELVGSNISVLMPRSVVRRCRLNR
jgi:hypothetical protein